MGNKNGKGYYTKHSSMRIHKDRQDAQSPSTSHKNSLERHKTSWPAAQGELVFCPEYTPKSQLAFEDFEPLQYIGKGAFGHVVKVQHRASRQVYAMKVLEKKEIIRSKAIRQCKEEVRIQLNLPPHPYITQAFIAWQSKNDLYIILEYAEHGDLFASWCCTPNRQVPLEITRLYSSEIALALDFLHSRHIIYRDLKLENILINSEGHVQLSDFGLSKITNVTDDKQSICGTTPYMAPEILSGQPYNISVDWWSLGIVMYLLSIGKFPFQHGSHQETYESIMEEPLLFPSQIDSTLSHVIRKLLQIKPSRRLQSLSKLSQTDFFACVDFAGLLARPKPTYSLSAPPAKRLENCSSYRRRSISSEINLHAIRDYTASPAVSLRRQKRMSIPDLYHLNASLSTHTKLSFRKSKKRKPKPSPLHGAKILADMI